jgi:hypothetical protein
MGLYLVLGIDGFLILALGISALVELLFLRERTSAEDWAPYAVFFVGLALLQALFFPVGFQFAHLTWGG